MSSKPSARLASCLLWVLAVAAGPQGAALAAAQPEAPQAAAPAAQAATPAAPAPVPERAAQQFAQAVSLMKAGRNTDAELELKQLTLAYPDLPGPQIDLGLLLSRAGRLPEAQAAFKAALAAAPNNAVAHAELGVVDRRLGKFTEAEQDYQRAISADPGYAPARLNLGILYDLYLAEPQKALDQFEQYLTLAGENKQVNSWVQELRKRLGIKAPAAPAATKESS